MLSSKKIFSFLEMFLSESEDIEKDLFTLSLIAQEKAKTIQKLIIEQEFPAFEVLLRFKKKYFPVLKELKCGNRLVPSYNSTISYDECMECYYLMQELYIACIISDYQIILIAHLATREKWQKSKKKKMTFKCFKEATTRKVLRLSPGELIKQVNSFLNYA